LVERDLIQFSVHTINSFWIGWEPAA